MAKIEILVLWRLSQVKPREKQNSILWDSTDILLASKPGEEIVPSQCFLLKCN